MAFFHEGESQKSRRGRVKPVASMAHPRQSIPDFPDPRLFERLRSTASGS
jgi:hypothetical protein